MTYTHIFWENIIGNIIVTIIVTLIFNCICGAITSSINTSKGYRSGFQWGFLLGILGIVVVACRPYEINYFCQKFTRFSSAEPLQSEMAAPAPEQFSQQIICPSCGSSSPADSTFCTKCGKSLKE